jgi:CSLREA domain-containing protein
LRKRNGVRVGILGAIVSAAISPGVAVAADFTVNTTADPAPDGSCGPPTCSLREAVTLAGGADRVILPAGTYVLGLGELVLIADTITGAGARSTIIDGNQASRVLRISAPAAGGLATSTVTGVTIRGGNGVGSASGIGGGVLVQSSPLQLGNSHVVANTAGSIGGGIGIQGNNSLVMTGSTVAGNTVTGRSVEGGGIGVSGEQAGIGLINSTVSGNAAVATIGSSAGGGIHAGLTPRLALGNVTIAGNSASAGGGLALTSTANPQFSNQMINTLLVGNTGGACLPGTGLPAVQTHHNLVQDSTCALAGTGDIQGIDAPLVALANNGGPTDTRAVPAGSPAIDKGGTCQQTDQRGIARPAAACDIGAFEHVAPTLRVVTQVVNDAGGTRTADQFNVHVRLGGTDVSGSPQGGSANGTTYTLIAGSTYSVAADTVAGYVLTVSGDCAANGSITLQENQARTCTVTANDIAPTLRVITNVVNNDGGTLTPANITAHVKTGGLDVVGSPQAGSAAGTDYTLSAGPTYTVSADAVAGYSLAVTGTCAANGNITLTLAQNATCTITASDNPPTLRVITSVVNDNGGTLPPGNFSAHVRAGGADVNGSPQPGTPSGTLYTLSAGVTYTVAGGTVAGYSFTISGDCAPNGTITMQLDQDRVCTIVANDGAATLTVVTQVVNDDGGAATPGDFIVSIRLNGTEVASRLGSAAGTAFSLAGNSTYAVTAAGATGYTIGVAGDCAGDGSVTLAVGASRTCSVTASDDPRPPGQPSVNQEQLPPPEAGRSVNALPKSGTVKVKLPGSGKYVDLDEAQQLPVGTVVDARKGHVTLIAAADNSGGTATAEFWAGVFRLTQSRGKAPTTILTLVEKLSCPKSGKASVAAKKKRKRRLWGDGSGKFQTKGKHSAATVVGTKWLVEDRCGSTLTRVVRGRVSVRDFVKKKTVIVRAGKKYVAKARR